MRRAHGRRVSGMRVSGRLARAIALVSILCAATGFGPAPTDSRILFARHTAAPRSVQAFAWRVIERRCNFQTSERDQRTFWAYDTRATRASAGTVYSVRVVSDLPWRKWEPSAYIEMTIVDDGELRLAALTSTYVACAA